ncbi:uncharacterized protein Z520_03667 [Fonsecaea multimorphosa CBS 102226]|uniref:Uncharacterized protein n=1 Tax=Fonsecaea multimorphosa CBS 102226 TaxID=1442371 RepID=A0A0D2HGI2_9EURO|nr:uncharacterized protein Z520_03667 [Fonsecaea multimorphosa CBS 102226]KIY01001.1 hypothetical protein Z520_03667 [Fonsecaea multimorphosa CBS 102226]OAL27586.1 hypothetical protein AYO22_03490 [Fonsecaea multimorphosa]
MATSLSNRPLTRLPRTLLYEDNSFPGLARLAILGGLHAFIIVACLALIVFVRATNHFGYVIFVLCLQLCPRIRETAHRSALRPINLARIQYAFEQSLIELLGCLGTILPYESGSLIRLAEPVPANIHRVEGFGEYLRPSSKQLCTPDKRPHLTPFLRLKAQGASRDHHYPCSPSRKSKRPKRDEANFLSGWSAAREDDFGSSQVPQYKSIPLLQQPPHLTQDHGNLIEHSSRRSVSKGRAPHPPHPSQPYRTQLPAPPGAPRPSVSTPPRDRLPQAAEHRTATRPAASAVCASLTSSRCLSPSTAKSRQQGIHILPGLPVADASESLRPQREEPNPTSKSVQASFTASLKSQATRALREFDVEPDGIIHVGGEAPQKRRRGGQSSSRPQGNASGSQNTNVDEESRDLPSEDDSEFADGRRDLNPNPDENTASESKGRGPPFRCPMYAANPQRYGGTKCEHWHGRSIADVTRHSLKDAGEGSDKWKEIKKLSSKKLTAEGRWRHYFLIFNDGTEADQMNHPYRVNRDPEDQVTDLLKSTIDKMRTDPDPTLALWQIENFLEILMDKKRRDIDSRRRCLEVKLDAMRQEAEALEVSRSKFTTQVQALLSTGISETLLSIPTAPIESHSHSLAGLATPQDMAIQRSYSGRGPEADMNQLYTPFPDHVPDPNGLMVQTGPPLFGGGARPLTQQQPVNEVIMATNNAMGGGGYPPMTNNTNTWQNSQLSHQQSHSLQPPQNRVPRSESDMGSSRPSAHRQISSAANSADDNSNGLGSYYCVAPSGDVPLFDRYGNGSNMQGRDHQSWQ